MSLVVGVRFREVGKIYYFDPNGFDFKRNDFCIVETDQGKEIAQIVFPEKEISDDKIVAPLKKIFRAATPADLEKIKENKELERSAFTVCQQKMKDRELPMKLVSVEYAFDGSKITFFFTAEGRIDFRELVKDLAHIFKTRIELRQIGVRDETKKYGGFGSCGREFCCCTWLADFVPVSIRMAKEQNLVLNPAKISGICGRLMCCLMFEYETYRSKRRSLPKIGSTLKTAKGPGRVKKIDILAEKVWVELAKGEELCLSRKELDALTPAERESSGIGKEKPEKEEPEK